MNLIHGFLIITGIICSNHGPGNKTPTAIFVPHQSLKHFQEQERDYSVPGAENISYGPYERNVLDFWKAESEEPTPLVVYIHGGGFRGGSKE